MLTSKTLFWRFLCACVALLVIVECTADALHLKKANGICKEIGTKVSHKSAVTYAGDAHFSADIHHWFGSSSQLPECVLEVGSAQDTSVALKVIARTKTPFSVQSGGHASNRGFSSTTGVHISLRRLQDVDLSSDKSTVRIGMGLTWADVYKELEDSGVNVVGGRTPGPGLGGFTLGGGFSWKTNQWGLTCDTIKSFNLVLPNGTIEIVDASRPDLFFALKGGLNRFGIVTWVDLRTHKQPKTIYGGFNLYTPDETQAVLNATTKFFQENQDPKAQIITTLVGSLIGTSTIVIFFYDGPTAPASFAQFEKITPLTLLPNVRSQGFSSFVSGIPSQAVFNPRGTFNTMSTSGLTVGFVDAVKREVDKYGYLMLLHGGSQIQYDLEPFLTSYGKKATDSAYPHQNSPLPLNIYFAWLSEVDDAFWYDEIRSSVHRLKKVAISEGIYVETRYPNYAIAGTTTNQLYGKTNTKRLRAIREQIDPNGVMKLAGGFDI